MEQQEAMVGSPAGLEQQEETAGATAGMEKQEATAGSPAGRSKAHDGKCECSPDRWHQTGQIERPDSTKCRR